MVRGLAFISFILILEAADPLKALRILTEATEEYYEDGDIVKLIDRLEEAHKLDPENRKITKILSHYLTKMGNEYYKLRVYRKAISCCERALKYDPANEAAKELRSKAIQMRKKFGEKLTFREKVQERLKKGPKKILKLEEYDIMPKFKDLKLPKINSSVNRLMLPFSVVVMALFLVHVFTIVSFKKRESKLSERIEFLMSKVVDQKTALATETEKLNPMSYELRNKRLFSIAEMIKDPNPRVRARGIELMEEDLKSESPKLVEKLIEPFLSDPSNRVRANAIKLLYSKNKGKALTLLKNMLQEEDKWMKASALWVIGEVVEPKQAYKIVKQFINDPDYHVRKRALKTLEKIKRL